MDKWFGIPSTYEVDWVDHDGKINKEDEMDCVEEGFHLARAKLGRGSKGMK